MQLIIYDIEFLPTDINNPLDPPEVMQPHFNARQVCGSNGGGASVLAPCVPALIFTNNYCKW